jgi:hypothetical protein
MASVFVHNKWAAALALPILLYPIIFVADLWYILYSYGHSIDPTSALGGAIDPFTPPLWGEGMVGQFGTVASFESGFYLSIAAVFVTLIGLWFHRSAYKPLVDARQKVQNRTGASA